MSHNKLPRTSLEGSSFSATSHQLALVHRATGFINGNSWRFTQNHTLGPRVLRHASALNPEPPLSSPG